jgi:hypothetical protein
MSDLLPGITWIRRRLFLACFPPDPRDVRELLVEGLAVADAAAHELRPVRNLRLRIGAFGQQAPQLRVMPAQLVAAVVTMLADAGAQPLHLGDERVAIEPIEIIIERHRCSG